MSVYEVMMLLKEGEQVADRRNVEAKLFDLLHRDVASGKVRLVVIEIPKATEKPDSLKVALLELEAEALTLTEEAEELEQRFEYLSGRLDAISKAATALKAVMGL